MQPPPRARSFLFDRRCRSPSASAIRPVPHSVPSQLSIVARLYEDGLMRSWSADSLSWSVARSRNYPLCGNASFVRFSRYDSREDRMRRFIEGTDRGQSTLFPECLEDWICEDNPVRVIDVFVEGLDLAEHGFSGVDPEATGRPSYHPSVLLKLYIYGYLSRVQSSRRLEREAGRNVEVMWLTGRLVPDHKTIADFRKDNGLAIRKVCTRFVALCRELGLLTTASVARYLSQLDTADLQEPSEALAAKTAHLKEKIVKLASEGERLKAIEKEMLASPDQQISLTDPDSRSMATSGRGSGTVGYNVQVAVDTQHHLIVAHEVTNSGSDRAQLANMGRQAKE